MASGIIFPSRANLGNTFAGCYDRRPSAPVTPTSPQQDGRRESVPTISPIRTRSVGGLLSAGVVFERDPNAVPSDDDIIIVTVKVSKKVRRNSYDDPLPERPPPRSFLRRMSTRILAQPDADTYKAVKMPRGDYQRYFRHDKDGNYCGTEPEREWSEEEIKEQYDQYRDVPLRHILF